MIIERLKSKRVSSYRNVKEFRKIYTMCTSEKLEANQQGEIENSTNNGINFIKELSI